MFKHTPTSVKAFYIFIIIAILTYAIPVKEIPLDVSNVLSATSIFYSILLGFYIASAMTNLSRLKTLAATETGALIAIYYQIKLALPKKLDEVRESIDHYLLKRFDYEIDDYTEPTTQEFFAIFEVLKGANPTSEGESAALAYVAEAQYYIAQARREISIVGARIVTSASWAILNVLSGIIVLSLFLMRDGGLTSSIVTIFLSSSALISLLILEDVDGNRFGEEDFAINTYQAVFKAIGKDNYYPSHYITEKRHKPNVAKYRTGTSMAVEMSGLNA